MSRLNRRKPLARGGRPKSRNAKRRNAEWTRAYGSEERVRFVQHLPCACGCGRFPCEVAHVVRGDGGMGRKASARFTAPLFPECHRLLHTVGSTAFQTLCGISLAECAERTERAWQQIQEAA